jgi:hypothetical protein
VNEKRPLADAEDNNSSKSGRLPSPLASNSLLEDPAAKIGIDQASRGVCDRCTLLRCASAM